MLRTSLRSVRGLSSRSVAAASGRQWQAAAAARPAGLVARRYFADEKTPASQVPKPPASETNTSPSSQTPPPPLEDSIDAKTIPAENVPLTPPAPEDLGAVTKEEKAVPPPPPPPPAGRGFFRSLRNYVLTLVILGAVAFGGGVWYSRINDSFHDFFTEYIPYGEQAVLYLEEADFRKRFPNISNRGTGSRQRDTGEAVRIPAQSGMSWRVADSGEPAGRQSSAVDKTAAAKKEAKAKESKPKAEPKADAPRPEEPKKAAPVAAAPAPAAATSDFKPPEVNEPSRFPPAAPLEPIYFPNVNEPVVQDLAHMLNDIIAVINADGAHSKYGSSIEKAKGELKKVTAEIDKIKAAVEADAASRVKTRVEEFDKAAHDLVTRVESAMASQEAGWQREFAEEMKRIKEVHDQRIKVAIDREQQINEERLNNKLLEQAIELKRLFAKEIQQRVEEERDGRLGKLEQLSKSVKDLENLAGGWNEVIDTNLRTQQLHVAVEAVRASLQDSAHPRPFIKELVALREIAADDAVVNAAIASINPTAYQRGIFSPQDLTDRFRRVATEVRKASLLPEDAGVASHASSLLLSKVMFKKQGLAAGDDVESVLTRTQTLLEEGDLDGAAREMNGLTGWAKTLSRDWLGEVRKVLEVRQALEVIQTEARLQSLKVE
ncbi:mitochondrial inner membrane protein mitofilin [Diaporthe amygdali]|uniref:mitochondrial inner membrane protein mitofilin n=1 Tax=Phomopsis amygdali TaxID=1214568 RepID=UPI0022FE2255|nr:mitochondrial inner membrane protein mitofilin [Diaporthe amygdali]KAJ0122226.1 mitochondrial inner membrane protein mitofilin [Diaporthe amygdali]